MYMKQAEDTLGKIHVVKFDKRDLIIDQTDYDIVK